MHSLQYKYAAGETLLYEHVANLAVDLPEGEQLVGRSTYEQSQQVRSEQGGRWEVVSRQRLVESDGELAPPSGGIEMPPQIFWMDSRGAAFQPGDGAPLCPAALPAHPVEAGSRWTRSDPPAKPGDPPVVTECSVESVEMEGEDRVFTMVGTGSVRGQDADGSSTTEIKGLTRFSETRGCLLSSRTVVTMQWDNGRRARTVLEIALKERR